MVTEAIHLGSVESRFAVLVWENAPIPLRCLVALCGEQLSWKRTTTYTVLHKCCLRGMFKSENGTVSVVISREEFFARQCEAAIERGFSGSLPAFLGYALQKQKLTDAERNQIQALLDAQKE